MSGKYDSELAETLHRLALDGTCETFGDVEAPCGHVSIVSDYCAPDGEATDYAADGDYIVIEDSAGFVSIEGPFEEVAIDAGGYYSPVARRADELRSLWDAWSALGEATAMPGELTGRRTGRPNLWWAVHNLIAHPVSEVCYWLRIPRFGDWLHDATVPEHEAGTGRG